MRRRAVFDVHIVLVSDHNATVAVTQFDGVLFTASSKRAPGDKQNREIGCDLAVARLLANISGRLERQANGAVRNAEHIRVQRLQRETRRKATEHINEVLANNATGRHEKKTNDG